MRLQYQKQSGVALITAILIVALVSIAAVAMTARQALDIRRTANILHSDQAYLYALSVEVFAKSILVEDQEPNVDYRAELGPGGFSDNVEGGGISGTIIDLNGAFPLNRLRRTTDSNNSAGTNNSDTDNSNGSVDPDYLRALERLLTALGLRAPLEAAAAVADWVDKGDTKLLRGFEDSDYLSLDKPYRTGDTELVSLSELLMILGFQKDDEGRDLDLLLPAGREAFVNVLPNGTNPTTINVNTASAEVLMSLHPLITDAVAAEIIAARPTATPGSLASATAGSDDKASSESGSFIVKNSSAEIANVIGDTYIGLTNTAPPANSKTPAPISLNTFIADVSKLDLSSTSDYFQVTSVGQIGESELTVVSVLHRPSNWATARSSQAVRTIRRGIGGY